jgi:CheY-like chemotaxis protein
MDSRYEILVIEDSTGDALLIREAFNECGYGCDLTIAPTHEEARAYIRERRFHLILCDCGESGEGPRMIHFVREHSPLTPVVVFSGYPDPRPAYTAGANAFVSKGVGLEELFHKVRGIMNFWIDVARLPKH